MTAVAEVIIPHPKELAEISETNSGGKCYAEEQGPELSPE